MKRKIQRLKRETFFVVFDFMEWKLNETTKRETKGNVFGFFIREIKRRRKNNLLGFSINIRNKRLVTRNKIEKNKRTTKDEINGYT